METKEYLTNYYETYDENGRLISKHGMVEYITTMKYVEKYLKPNMRVLEIGAATGRYSHALAQKGYRVDAVELVEHNIGIFKQNTIEGQGRYCLFGRQPCTRRGTCRNQKWHPFSDLSARQCAHIQSGRNQGLWRRCMFGGRLLRRCLQKSVGTQRKRRVYLCSSL